MHKYLLLAASISFILLSQHIFGDYGMSIMNNICIFIILAVSYNLINGVCGQFSLEPNGFVAVGAYVAALLLLSSEQKLNQFNLEDPHAFILWLHTQSFYLALLAAGFFAWLLSFILSFAVFRVRGDYLAIVTLGFGIIIKICAINFASFTNGALGLNEIPRHSNIYVTGAFAIISTWLILNLIYSKYGRAMKAVRDDEDAASAMGIDSFWTKSFAFGTSAFFEGVAGALLVCLLASISPEQFDFFLTFQLLIIIVLGGLGSVSGSILGVILVIGGSEWLRFLDEPMNIFGYQTQGLVGLRLVVFSLILILVMLFARRGIFGDKELFAKQRKTLPSAWIKLIKSMQKDKTC